MIRRYCEGAHRKASAVLFRGLQRDVTDCGKMDLRRGVPRVCLLSAGLLILGLSGGCSTFGERYHRDDVVLARQIARQGADAFHNGDWDQAEQCYAKAVETCPVDERVRARYAETLWKQQRYEEAIKHQQEAVRISGGATELIVRLSEMYLTQGDLHRADHLIKRAIKSGRESAVAYRVQGDILERQGDWDGALAAYHRALSIQSDYPEVRMALARVYLRAARPQRALATLQALADTYPPNEKPADLAYWQALAFAALGRHSRAVDHFVMAESRGMQSADLLFQLAHSHYLAGEITAARRVLQQAMHVAPTHPQAPQLCDLIQNERRTARRQN